MTGEWVKGVLAGQEPLVFFLGIDDDRDFVDCADEALLDGAVGLFGVLLTIFGVEPESMREALHHGPLIGGEVDLADTRCLLAGFLPDVIVAKLHPPEVFIGVSTLATVHAVRAVNLEGLAGLMVLKVLVPTDASVSADSIRISADTVLIRGTRNGPVQRVGIGSTGGVFSHFLLLFVEGMNSF